MDVELNVQQTFPVGTTLKVFAASDWAGHEPPNGAPKGAELASGVVGATGVVNFAGLPDNSWFYVGAQVGGIWKYLRFSTLSSPRTISDVDADLAEVAAVPNLVLPMVAAGNLLVPSTIVTTTNRIYVVRARMPKSGRLRDLSCFVTTKSGSGKALVYDTGDAASGKRTKLFDSGFKAVASENAWNVLGDPDIEVERGDQLDLAIQFDNAVVVPGRFGAGAHANGSQLPTGFNPVAGGALPKMWAFFDPGGATAPAAVDEAALEKSGSALAIIARIS